MRKHLKNYFIPHEGNDHQPHFLREKCLGVVLVIVIVAACLSMILAIPAVSTRFNYLASILPTILVEKANESRAEIGENQLVMNDVLSAAAQLKANDMAAKGYFSHISPDGTSPWFWIQKAGYAYTDAGENLAVNFMDSDEVHNAWMNSPGHRANILRNGFTEIGIATASGTYNGRSAIFVVQYFGKPRPTLVQVTSSAPIFNTTQVSSAPTSSTLMDSGETSSKVLGEQYTSTTTMVSSIHQLTWYERAAAAPRTTLLWLLGIIAGIVSVALLLKIFVARHIQYPRLILNGVLVVAIVAVLMGVSEMMGDITGLVQHYHF